MMSLSKVMCCAVGLDLLWQGHRFLVKYLEQAEPDSESSHEHRGQKWSYPVSVDG